MGVPGAVPANFSEFISVRPKPRSVSVTAAMAALQAPAAAARGGARGAKTAAVAGDGSVGGSKWVKTNGIGVN